MYLYLYLYLYLCYGHFCRAMAPSLVQLVIVECSAAGIEVPSAMASGRA